jgi:hypothetical protein
MSIVSEKAAAVVQRRIFRAKLVHIATSALMLLLAGGNAVAGVALLAVGGEPADRNVAIIVMAVSAVMLGLSAGLVFRSKAAAVCNIVLLGLLVLMDVFLAFIRERQFAMGPQAELAATVRIVPSIVLLILNCLVIGSIDVLKAAKFVAPGGAAPSPAKAQQPVSTQ